MGELLADAVHRHAGPGRRQLAQTNCRRQAGKYADRRGLHKFDVHIANHVICKVVADVQMLYLAVLVHLLKDVLIEILFSHTSVSRSHSLDS